MSRLMYRLFALDTIFISFILVAKAVWFSNEMHNGANLFTTAVSSLGVTLVITSWVAFLHKGLRGSMLILIDTAVSLLLLADLVFYRFYHSLITTNIMQQAGQTSEVGASISTLLFAKDALLFADLIVLVPLVFFTHVKRNGMPAYTKSKTYYVIFCYTIGFTIATGSFGYVAKAYDKESAANIHENALVLNHLGALSYHVADVVLSRRGMTSTVTGTDVQRRLLDKQPVVDPQLFGVAKGKNLIVIQMEAMQQFVIGAKVNGKEITPNLNKFLGESMYFDNYFSEIAQGNTSDAEFMSLNSLYPLSSGSAYVLKNQNTFRSLPTMLRENGYESYVLHSFNEDYYSRNKMYPAEGFTKFISNKEFKIPAEDVLGLGLADKSMFTQSVAKIKATPDPSMFFAISLSGHHPYKIPDTLKELQVPADYDPLFTDYLHAQHYADQALGGFLNDLRREGILDNAVVAIYGDHFGPGLHAKDIYKLQGQDHAPSAYEAAELYRVPLFIRLPNGQNAGVIHTTGGQMDLFPTLANFMGIDSQKVIAFGHDLMNIKSGFAAFRQYLPAGSFVDEKVFYVAAPDGQFNSGACYNRDDGKTVGIGQCRPHYEQIKKDIKMSDYVIAHNLMADPNFMRK